jgi:hypothetical protein
MTSNPSQYAFSVIDLTLMGTVNHKNFFFVKWMPDPSCGRNNYPESYLVNVVDWRARTSIAEIT